MYYVLGESRETGEFEIWEQLSAKEAMAVRNEYIKMGLQTRSGKMNKQVDIYCRCVKLFIQLENNIAQESQNANTKERFQNY